MSTETQKPTTTPGIPQQQTLVDENGIPILNGFSASIREMLHAQQRGWLPSADVMSSYEAADPEWRTKVLITPIENAHAMWNADKAMIGADSAEVKYRDMMLNNPKWGQKFTSMWNAIKTTYNISGAEVLPGEINFTTLLLGPLVPELIGRQLFPTYPVTEPDSQFPVLSKGRSEKGARGIDGTQSRTGRLTYKHLKIRDDAIVTRDEIDMNQIEDMQTAMVAPHWQELGRAHREDVSQEYIDAIWKTANFAAVGSDGLNADGTFTDESDNEHKKAPSAGAAAINMNVIIDAIINCRRRNVMGDCMLTDWTTIGALLKDSAFQNAEQFQQYADFGAGMIRSILGLRIFVSNQVPINSNGAHFLIYQKNRYVQAAMRRDELITNIDNKGELSQGLNISTRLGFGHKDGEAAYLWQET